MYLRWPLYMVVMQQKVLRQAQPGRVIKVILLSDARSAVKPFLCLRHLVTHREWSAVSTFTQLSKVNYLSGKIEILNIIFILKTFI